MAVDWGLDEYFTGDDIERFFDVEDEDGEAQDVTGWTSIELVLTREGDDSDTLTLSGSIVDADDGVVKCTLAAASNGASRHGYRYRGVAHATNAAGKRGTFANGEVRFRAR